MKSIANYKFTVLFLVGVTLSLVTQNYLGIGLSLVGIVGAIWLETKQRNTVSFVIEREITRSTWRDHQGLPGYLVVQTTEGETILSIHGNSDGQVWAYEDRRHCNFAAFLERLPVKIDKIVCCYPAAVKRVSGVSVPFVHQKYNRPVSSSIFWLKGLKVEVSV